MREHKVIIIKKDEKPKEPSRSELTLLYELIQRNPERAKEFIRRLNNACKPQDVVLNT